MIHLQKNIVKLLQEEFDKNTQGLDFEVSLYSVKNNSKLENIINVPNTYATERKRFIPVIVEDIDGEYTEVETLNSVEPIISLTMLVPTEEFDINNQVIEETYEKVGLALDEMRVRLLGKPLPLGERCFILPEEYSLEIEDLTNISANGLKLDLEFTDISSGAIFTLFNDKHLRKTAKKVFYENEELFTYEKDKRYVIELKSDNNNYEWFVDGEKVGSTITGEALASDSVILGGVLTKIYSFSLYDSTSDVILTIDDFESVPNAIVVDQTQVTTSRTNEKFVMEWGSLGKITLGFTIPNPSTQQFSFGDGLNYQEFNLALTSTVSDNIFGSNEIKYFLNNVRIYPFFRDHSYVGEPSAAQKEGSGLSKNIVSQSMIATEFSLFLKPEKQILDLAKQMTSISPSPNTLYQFEVIFPLFGRTYQTIVTQGGLSVDGNEPIAVSFKLDIADEVLTEEAPIIEPPETEDPISVPAPLSVLQNNSSNTSILLNITSQHTQAAEYTYQIRINSTTGGVVSSGNVTLQPFETQTITYFGTLFNTFCARACSTDECSGYQCVVNNQSI